MLRYRIAPKCLLPGPFGHSDVGGNPGVAGRFVAIISFLHTPVSRATGGKPDSSTTLVKSQLAPRTCGDTPCQDVSQLPPLATSPSNLPSQRPPSQCPSKVQHYSLPAHRGTRRQVAIPKQPGPPERLHQAPNTPTPQKFVLCTQKHDKTSASDILARKSRRNAERPK